MIKCLNTPESILLTGSFLMILYIFDELVEDYNMAFLWLTFPLILFALAMLSYVKREATDDKK